MLVAISISGTATAAPQKRERPHRPSMVEVIEHRVMAAIAVVEGAIARGGRAAMEAKVQAAMGAKAKAAMGAKAKAGMEAKAQAAMGAKAKAGMETKAKIALKAQARAGMEAKANISVKAQAKAGVAKRNASTEGIPCPYNNDRPALRSLSIDAPSSRDENRCQ
jgi:hypothetical protein